MEDINKLEQEIKDLKEDLDERKPMYLQVQFQDKFNPERGYGNYYSYKTFRDDLVLNQLVEVPTRYGTGKAYVAKLNLDESEVADYIDKLQEIL